MKRNGFDCLRLCACAALSFTVPAFADDWSWSGKTGNVTIPSGVTAYVGDADVATVSALTGIEIPSGATLFFTNAAECALSAVLTGDGSCKSSGGARLTFAGESPSFTGEMHFTNSYVRVASSRWGLGCGTNSSGQVRYVTSALGGLMFTADGICDPGIYWYGHRHDPTAKYLMDDMSRNVVFNGPVKMNKKSNVDWLRTGNFTFNAGLGVNGSQGTPCFYVGGSRASVTTIVNNVAMNGGNSYFPVCIEQNAVLLLNAQGMTGGHIVFYGLGTLVCGTNDVLPQAQKSACGLGKTGGKSGTIDLNGYDQSVKRLSSSTYNRSGWWWDVTRGEGNFVIVTSAKDAAIRITGNESPNPHACRFTGKASLVQAGGGTYTLVNEYSDTEGTLCVTNGTVKFDWGAGWGGDIEVFEKGRVVLSEICAKNIAEGCGEVRLHEGAKLVIGTGVPFRCSKLIVGGEEIPDGTYTSAALEGWIEGEGTIAVESVKEYTVREWSGEGTGWSDSENWGGTVPGPGDKVLIPSGATVQVTDADVDTIESVAAIEIAEGGKLEFVNLTKAVVLTNDISGSGAIRSSASAGITLAGLNLFHQGSMEFTNTAVYVTSRYGLGSPTRYIVHWGSQYGNTATPLRFRGAGLTNDVPVKLEGTRYVQKGLDKCFTDTPDDPWVQNGYLDYIQSSQTPPFSIGNYVFAGGLRNSKGSLQFQVAAGRTCTIRTTPLALDTSSNWSHFDIEAGGIVRLEVAGNGWQNSFSINGKGRFLCCVENALAENRSIGMAQSNGAPVMDLQGNDQKCLYISNARAPKYTSGVLYVPVRGSYGYGTVTSEEPATMTMTASCADPVALRFTGAVSLNCTGSGTNTYVNRYSDTAGTLSLTNGAVKFDWGAGWGGDISLSKKGRVIFAESCPSNRIGQGTGAVTLKDSARIVLSDGARYSCGSVMLGDTLITCGVLTAEKYPEWIEGDGVVYVGKRGMILSIR